MMRLLHILAVPLLLLSTGCDLGLDPDGLVRELRLLGARQGAAGEVADLQFSDATLRFSSLWAPGRRLDPRQVQLDWYLCLQPRSLSQQGLDIGPDCTRSFPSCADPAQKGTGALRCLGHGDAPQTQLGPLRAELMGRVTAVLGGMGAAALPVFRGLLPLQLPVVLHAGLAGSTDPLQTETGFMYLRLVLPVDRGAVVPPPNHNPKLLGLRYSFDPNDMEGQPLPAALTIGRKQALYLKAAVTPDSIEIYDPIDDSMRTQVAEIMRYSWFGSDGKFSEERTGDKLPWTRWSNEAPFEVPPEVSTLDLWVVAQDDRGGADWQAFTVQLK